MKKILSATLCAAALCVGAQAHANLITFDNPGLIDIDDATNIATYTESGFTLSGPAATFLPLDSALVGGLDSSASLSLKALGGAVFSLASFDYAFYDFGFGDAPGSLSVVGLLNGVTVGSTTFTLGSQSTAGFGSNFGMLTELTFGAAGGFALDNINATPAVIAAPVPEPATWALSALALLGVAVRVRQTRRSAQ